jgi:hypothetical protein
MVLGGLFSVTLSVTCDLDPGTLVFTRHAALRCSDFPLARKFKPAIACHVGQGTIDWIEIQAGQGFQPFLVNLNPWASRHFGPNTARRFRNPFDIFRMKPVKCVLGFRSISSGISGEGR